MSPTGASSACGCPATSWRRGRGSCPRPPPGSLADVSRPWGSTTSASCGAPRYGTCGHPPGRPRRARLQPRATAQPSAPALPVGVALVAQGSIVDVAPRRGHRRPRRSRSGRDDPRPDRRSAARQQGARAARPGRIRPCVLCNQTCRVRDVRNPIVTCIGDPRSGHETHRPAPPTRRRACPAGTSPRAQRTGLLVIGGGPAGLECARVAASAGHEVTLLERGERLGGMVRVAARAPGRERLELLVEWLEAECRRGRRRGR